MSGTSHLLIYEFGPEADFEGRLVGALERIQDAGKSRVLDGLFVANQVEADALVAIDLRSGSAASTVARLLTIRLDDRARRHATEQLLNGNGSVPADVVRELGGSLKPGGAVLALLIDRPGWQELGDAVSRTGGSLLSEEIVHSGSLAELAPRLLAAVSSPRRS